MGIIDTSKEMSEELMDELKDKSEELKHDLKEKSDILFRDLKEKFEELLNDEKFADVVVIASEKQKSVNEVLKKRGSDCRLGAIEIGMGIPPLVTFKVLTKEDDGSE